MLKIKKNDNKTDQLIKLWNKLSSEQREVTLMIIQRIFEKNKDNGSVVD